MKSRRSHLQEKESENRTSLSKSVKTPRTPMAVNSERKTPLKSESSRRTRNTSISAVKCRSVKSETKSRKEEVGSLPTRKSARILKLLDSAEDSKSDSEKPVNNTFTYESKESSDGDVKTSRTPKTRKLRKRHIENACGNEGEGPQPSALEGDETFLIETEAVSKRKYTRKSKAHVRNSIQKKSSEFLSETDTETPPSDEEAFQKEAKNANVKSRKKRLTRLNSRNILHQQDENEQQSKSRTESEPHPHIMESGQTTINAVAEKTNLTPGQVQNETFFDETSEQLPLAEVEQLPLAEVEKLPLAELEQLPLSEVEQLPLAEVEQLPLAEVEQLPLAEVEQLPLAEVDQLPLVEVEQLPLAEVEQLPLAEVEQLPLAEVEQLPFAEVEQLPLAEVEQLPLAEVEQLPLAEVEQLPLAEVEQLPLAEVEQLPLAEVEQLPLAEVEQLPLAEVEQLPLATSVTAPEAIMELNTSTNEIHSNKNVRNLSSPRTAETDMAKINYSVSANSEDAEVKGKDFPNVNKSNSNNKDKEYLDPEQNMTEYENITSYANKNLSQNNTTMDSTSTLEDLENLFGDNIVDTSKNATCNEDSLICHMSESVISVDSSIISLTETPKSQNKDFPKNTVLRTPITSAKKAASKPNSLAKTPVFRQSYATSITKAVKRLQTPGSTPLIDQNRSRKEGGNTPFIKGGINSKASTHSVSKLSSKKLELIVKEVKTPKDVPEEVKVLKSIRKRSMSYSDVDLVKSAAKSKVTFHSPSNLTIPIEDIDKSLMVYQKSASKRVEGTSPNRKRTFSVSQIYSGGKDSKISATGETPSKVKKLEKQPSRTKMPNFSAIHKHTFDKMESIFDHIKKKEERAKALSATKTKPDSLHQSAKKIDPVIKGNRKENEANPKTRQKLNLTNFAVIKKDSSQPMEVKKHPTDVLRPISVPTVEKKDNNPAKEAIQTITDVLKPAVKAALRIEDIAKPDVDKQKHSTNVAVVKPIIKAEKMDKVSERRKKHEAMLKSRTRNPDGTLNQNVEFVKGIRSNRRFELQMLHRNKQ